MELCDENGAIITNSEYAIACKLLEKPLLVYKMHNEKVESLKYFLNENYGKYYFDNLQVKDYNQTFCQMNRLSGEKELKSTTYIKYVLPKIDKNMRILDFGSGKCSYSQKLKNKGYKIFMYEPFYRCEKVNSFDIENIAYKMYINSKDEMKKVIGYENILSLTPDTEYDAEKDFMGLLTFKGNHPTLIEAKTAKNYLNEKELRAMGQLVSGYLDFAERQAEREQAMTMNDWAAYLDRILTMTGEQLLQDNGSVSHEEAMEHATTEYRKYKQRTISDVERDYLFSIKAIEDLGKKKN